jgi:hypothetical protein
MGNIRIFVGDSSNPLAPTDDELNEFADYLEDNGVKVDGMERLGLDSFIPFPTIDKTVQLQLILNCAHEGMPVYWQRPNGRHGWCCKSCGTVTQWG